jgi:hypothetical protein
MTGWFLLIVLIFLSLFPLFALCFVADLYSVRIVPFSYGILLIVNAKAANFVPFLANWKQASPVTFDIISGVLPPLLYSLFDFAFEDMIFRLSKYKGAATQSRLQNAILARQFAFLVISELIIFTLIGVGLSACDIVPAFSRIS